VPIKIQICILIKDVNSHLLPRRADQAVNSQLDQKLNLALDRAVPIKTQI
jgi:hypothetical protein